MLNLFAAFAVLLRGADAVAPAPWNSLYPEPTLSPTQSPTPGGPCSCTGTNSGISMFDPHFMTDFGQSCKKWDEPLSHCQKGHNWAWCADKWCYVEEGCTVNGKVAAWKSRKFASGLWFSFSVCGNEDRFKEEEFVYDWDKCADRAKPVNMYFAIDSSGSINRAEWGEMQQFIKNILERGLMGIHLGHPDDKVGITTWSNAEYNYKRYGFDTPVPDIIADIGNLPQVKGSTHTDKAILFALKKMGEETWGPGANRHLILVTDGEPDVGYGPCDDGKKDEVRQRLDSLGVRIGVLAIDGEKNPKDYYGRLGCLVEEPYRDIVVMKNFYSFGQFKDPSGGDLCISPNLFSSQPTSAPVSTPAPFSSPAPTPSPSRSPSRGPTNPPTADPSRGPTASPTSFPTRGPTDSPTDGPTRGPTNPPTHGPSFQPTSEPSNDPTDGPTREPTGDECVRKREPVRNEEECSAIRHEVTCEDLLGCKWVSKENCQRWEKPHCKKSEETYDSGMRWVDTHGPHFWKTCASKYCLKHSWLGGINRCHYDAELGCGCTGLSKDECEGSKGKKNCEWDNCQCQERKACAKMDFDECLKSNRCDVCEKSCVEKCVVGEGQEIPDNTVLMLDHRDCKCRFMTMYTCPKNCWREKEKNNE